MKLEYRMYGLVPYNISPIQQAIQYGHALQEYNNKYFHYTNNDDFVRWRSYDKTFIILNGGTTGKQTDIETNLPHGTMNQHLITLREHKIKYAAFTEPDLGNQLTAIVFLADERVWDKKKYPDFAEYIQESEANILSNLLFKSKEIYSDWEESIGGEENIWLREFLSQFKLA